MTVHSHTSIKKFKNLRITSTVHGKLYMLSGPRKTLVLTNGFESEKKLTLVSTNKCFNFCTVHKQYNVKDTFYLKFVL